MNARGEIYKGTVELRVSVAGSYQSVIGFVQALRERAGFRMLSLVCDANTEDVGIWLALQRPVPLESILMTINGVSGVDPSPVQGEQPVLVVLLEGSE